VRSDVLVGAHLQFVDIGHAITLPHLRLPQCIEALNGVLHAVFERRREDRNNFELQTQATDRTYGVGKVVRAL